MREFALLIFRWKISPENIGGKQVQRKMIMEWRRGNGGRSWELFDSEGGVLRSCEGPNHVISNRPHLPLGEH